MRAALVRGTMIAVAAVIGILVLPEALLRIWLLSRPESELAALRTAYDAVIADVKMPEFSGQELYGRVCQIRPEMARRFLFITGDIDGEDTREFLDQSGCSYFMKPFNLERLIARLTVSFGLVEYRLEEIVTHDVVMPNHS